MTTSDRRFLAQSNIFLRMILSFLIFLVFFNVPVNALSINPFQHAGGLGTSLLVATNSRFDHSESKVVINGTLSVRWIDHYFSNGFASHERQYILQTADYRTMLLIPAGNGSERWEEFAGQKVSLEGERTYSSSTGASADHELVLRVHSIKQQENIKVSAVASIFSGSQPYVTILCKFPEEPNVTYPKSWFETMMGSQYPGMDHYWREVSYNTINLAGSMVAGWYELPKTRAEYINMGGDVGGNKSRDCMTKADPDVYFPDFVGINIIIDKEFDTCCNITGGADVITVALDGGGQYRYTSTGTSTFTPHYVMGVLQHEMGHTFGMGHSSGPYTEFYDSGWDVMSGYGSGLQCDWTQPACYQHPDFAYLGPHPIAYNKTIPGWIPDQMIFTVETGTGYMITLERLAQPSSGNDLMVRVPINGSVTEFFTVEARKFVGHDAFLAQRTDSEAVLIHRVDTTRDANTGPADVVDPDNNGNPNDAGAAWTAGETYTDSTNDITISILSSTPTGFVLKVTNQLLFGDVLTDYWASNFIERLYGAGITGGCALSPLQYCPETTVTRSQMAVFLERGIHGSSYDPPAVGGSTGFGDVPVDYWSAAWIKQLAAEGITGGCGSGNYCPEYPVTRDQMAVFLLRSKYGSSYSPPAVGISTGFGDVPVDHWAAPWIKQLVTEGITAGCGSGNYCPDLPVTRAQMAVFLVRTFNLP